MNRLHFSIVCCAIFLVMRYDDTLLAQPSQKKLTSTAYQKNLLTDNSPDEISYKISMAKKVYRYGERKVVTSTIKNIGKRNIRVRLPHAIDEIVTYKVFKKTSKGRKKEGSTGGRQGGALTLILELAPGETCSSACELDFVLGGDF